MPAWRRFLTAVFPRCFGTTQTNSKYEYDTPNTPNKLSNGKVKNSKSSLSYGRSTFGGTGITKTMETRVESRAGEDDEIQLVDMERARDMKDGWDHGGGEVDAGSDKSAKTGQQMHQGTFLRS
jgi:hypothetical protein